MTEPVMVLGNQALKVDRHAYDRFRSRRHAAHTLRRFNRKLLYGDVDLKSIAKCGNTLGSTVVYKRSRNGRCRVNGVATCKSMWGCLGCAARRRALKSAMVKYYVDAHRDAGKGVSFASFTLAHYPTDSLHDLLEALRKSFTDMRHLKVYKQAEADYGVIGWIAALEITHGINGWHPHLHVLYFHDEPLDVESGANHGFNKALYEAFGRQIDRHLNRQIHHIHGVTLVPVRRASREQGDDHIAEYLGKIQLELTRQDLKTAKGDSRSPWQIALDAAETGDAQDAARWCEYLRATKGRNVITTGGHLAELHGEPTEEQLNALIGDDDNDDDQGETTGDDEQVDIASSDSDLWRDLTRCPTRPGDSPAAYALEALERDGPDAMAVRISKFLDKPVDVTTHPETGLPHLRYANPEDRRPPRTKPPTNDPTINLDQLGPAARAWYGATRKEPHP
ncbi:MAG: hypothetical protein AAGD35_22090 [Actinomycetota bacterium]